MILTIAVNIAGWWISTRKFESFRKAYEWILLTCYFQWSKKKNRSAI